MEQANFTDIDRDFAAPPAGCRIVRADALTALSAVPDRTFRCCVTSPPYWGLRDYGVEHQIGAEPRLEDYISNLRAVFAEVRRTLADDGTLWLNIGDSYTSGGRTWRDADKKNKGRAMDYRAPTPDGLKPKDLIGVPWRLAFALQGEGWHLRSDIIWCLSGGAWVYAKTQKGPSPMMVREVARCDPASVQLWNGQKWTQLLGMSRSPRRGDEIELVLRSGERISCTPTHKFPTRRGLLAASGLSVGDVLETCPLHEPEAVIDCLIGDDAAWFAGLYVAEGSRSGGTIQIAGHADEEERWVNIQRIARLYGGSSTRTVKGNMMDIRVYGRMLNALIDELVTGNGAKTKAFNPGVWRYSNRFLTSLLLGYLSGDGHLDEKNRRWRIGFTRNYNLERDLRTLCARLGYGLTLNLASTVYQGRTFPTFRGEIRMERSGHHNERDRGEVVEIRKARCREIYDLGVADDPHIFALASGVLTHNSKPNCQPESVKDRPTRAHEYLFLFSKSEKYYYDHEAIKEPTATTGLKNRRSVWSINTEAFAEAHFAAFPTKLVEPCILAGSQPGDTVLDPFFGSGTVGLVASRLGRKFLGVELSEEYASIARRRLGWTKAV